MPQAQVIDSQVIQAPERLRGRQPRVDVNLAVRVHEALRLAEKNLDEAFIAAAELTVMLPAMRGQTNLAFCVPQSAIEAGSVTIASLTKARADLQAMHDQLAQLRDKLRVPATMDGPFHDKLDNNG
jgi:hypothetical protein